MLDEERREAFLQALQSLQEEQQENERREREEKRYQEEQLKKDVEDARRRRIENEEREKRVEEERKKERVGGSEVDYGVEDSPPRPGSSKSRSLVKAGSAKGGRSIPASSPTARSSVPAKNVKAPPSLITRAGNVVMNLRKLVESMVGNFKTRPLLLMQMLAFVVGILVLLSRRDVKERVKRILEKGWGKVRQTAGMGVKVSYI